MTANERRDLWRLFQRQGKAWEEFVAAGETPEEQVARFDTQHENFVADLPPQESDEAFMTRVFGYAPEEHRRRVTGCYCPECHHYIDGCLASGTYVCEACGWHSPVLVS